jgi:hypothetical protein
VRKTIVSAVLVGACIVAAWTVVGQAGSSVALRSYSGGFITNERASFHVYNPTESTKEVKIVLYVFPTGERYRARTLTVAPHTEQSWTKLCGGGTGSRTCYWAAEISSPDKRMVARLTWSRILSCSTTCERERFSLTPGDLRAVPVP